MWKKILVFAVSSAAVAAGGGLAYLYLRKPAMAPPPAILVAMTPERIERGRYLFQKVMDCDGCHSQRDFGRFGGPVIEAGRGRGFIFPSELGLPGTIVASNITPDKETGIGAWTDGEKIRAIREGIGRDGRALFPMMPYRFYRHMSDEDVEALVTYLNTLAPVRNSLPRSKVDFPVSLLMKTAPEPAGRVPPPDRANQMKYGEYLVTLGGCLDCHTPMAKGESAPGMRLAGGREFRFPGMIVLSANITPHEETGIGRWSEQQFIEKFYQYREYAAKGSPKVGPESFTLMPWLGMSQLSPEELGAILAYLKTQPAVRNSVELHPGVPRT